jgi:hypothetical protein
MIENVLNIIMLLAMGGALLMLGIWVILHFFDD